MKKPNITPGPWKINPIYGQAAIMTVEIKSDNYSVGKVAPNNRLDNEIANAQAISAVPKYIHEVCNAIDVLKYNCGHESDLPDRISLSREQYYEILDGLTEASEKAGVTEL